MNLLISLRSELLKTRRTAAFYFTIIGAAIVPIILLINILGDPEDLDFTSKDPINGILKLIAEMNGMVIFPMFVMLVCTLLPQIEFKNNTWKQVLTSPQTKANVFMAKMVNAQILILIFLLATHLFTTITIVAAHFIRPAMDLLNQPFNKQIVLTRAVNSYIAVLALFAIQFWLGLRFKNFIVPIAIGLACWIAGMFMVFGFDSSLAKYFPYSFHILALSQKHIHLLPQVEWTSLVYAAIFLLFGFIDFKRRRMTG